MTIEAYTGYPGTGKTFGLTHLAWKDMKKGYNVFTSYPCKGAYKFSFEDLCNYNFPPRSTVIIDESGRWFNSRKWKDLPPAVFDLFTLHRHLKLDLIIAVQNFNRIDVSLREVIEHVWWARNYWYLPFFVYELYFEVEHLGLSQEVQKRKFVWRWSRSRRLYDTHIMSREINKDTIPMVLWGAVPVENNYLPDILYSAYTDDSERFSDDGNPNYSGQNEIVVPEHERWGYSGGIKPKGILSKYRFVSKCTELYKRLISRKRQAAF